MNFLEKMKLKAQLRNCNYELAGTVLKQQFYDYDKNTELNRLIDTLIEKPCFENAMDIIEQNEMYIFYFTESCYDGLYVRKSNEKDKEKETEPSRNEQLHDALAQQASSKEEEHQHENKVEEPTLEENKNTSPKVNLTETKPQLQKREPRVQRYEKEENTKREMKMKEKNSTKESLKESIKGSLKKLVRETLEDSTPAKTEKKKQTAPTQQAAPVQKQATSFKNVIETLQIDVDEMKKQRDEYQQRIYHNDPQAVKLKRWIVALDDAIDEFSRAIEELKRHRK